MKIIARRSSRGVRAKRGCVPAGQETTTHFLENALRLEKRQRWRGLGRWNEVFEHSGRRIKRPDAVLLETDWSRRALGVADLRLKAKPGSLSVRVGPEGYTLPLVFTPCPGAWGTKESTAGTSRNGPRAAHARNNHRQFTGGRAARQRRRGSRALNVAYAPRNPSRCQRAPSRLVSVPLDPFLCQASRSAGRLWRSPRRRSRHQSAEARGLPVLSTPVYNSGLGKKYTPGNRSRHLPFQIWHSRCGYSPPAL